ncbi:MAG: hypothetical protein M3P92_02230 [Actinomycetota bacterium]|nr:hypothetical protein [Actinomycetota bacterium]
MVVLVNLKEGVGAEEYERWAQEAYAPAVKALPSVRDWRAHRVSSLLASDEAPPYRYVVTVDIDGLAPLGRDMAGEEMRGLLSELHRFAEVVQLCRRGSSTRGAARLSAREGV